MFTAVTSPTCKPISITFDDDGNTKTIIGKADDRPEEILTLEAALDEIADDPEGWREVEGFSDPNVLPDGTITNEIIVQLVSSISADEWVGKYSRYDTKLVESLSPSGSYWLITFNTESVDPDLLLENIRNDPEVIGAEFNIEIDVR